MSKVTSYFAEVFKQLNEALSRFSLRVRPKKECSQQKEYPPRECFNQVNAIISCFPDEERRLLPPTLVEYFAAHADLQPNDSLDMSKPLEQQSLSDETLLFLFYINSIFKEIKKSNAVTEEELHGAHVQATKEFIAMMNGETSSLWK